MSKLIIIRGNSGSGKTTVSKALQQKFGRNVTVQPSASYYRHQAMQNHFVVDAFQPLSILTDFVAQCKVLGWTVTVKYNVNIARHGTAADIEREGCRSAAFDNAAAKVWQTKFGYYHIGRNPVC